MWQDWSPLRRWQNEKRAVLLEEQHRTTTMKFLLLATIASAFPGSTTVAKGDYRLFFAKAPKTRKPQHGVSVFDAKATKTKTQKIPVPKTTITAGTTLTNGPSLPIAGATLENGILKLNSENKEAATFLVITSDYLMNGGDKMDFFSKRVSDKTPGVLLRDAMISEAKSQGTLLWNDDQRIKL